jgi:hydroxymethylbilane synthase
VIRLRIATRISPLAKWQALHVAGSIQKLEPDVAVDLVERTTRGDKILDQALSQVGGKDLFVKEIEEALLKQEAEAAVHSLKDMPTELPAGLQITAFIKREDPRDALVSSKGYTLMTLPKHARIGTSSLRRGAQLLALRPDLEIVPIRGNVQTRLGKLETNDLAATVLAHAGLVRLGLREVVTEILEPDVCLPAIGQGILAVETRTDAEWVNALIDRLDDPSSRASALAERAFLRRLEGGCQVPIAAHATLSGGRLEIQGLVASLDGRKVVRGERRGPAGDAQSIGDALGQDLLEKGAGLILDQVRTPSAQG